MPNLESSGAPVEDGGVIVSSPGLAGDFTVHRPPRGKTRSVGSGLKEALEDALEGVRLREQVTVSIGARPVGGAPRFTRSSASGRDTIGIQVEAASGLEGQVALLIDEDGSTVSWHFPQEEKRAQVAPTRSGRKTATFDIDAEVLEFSDDSDTPGTAVAKRGIVGIVGRKILRVLTYRIVKKATGMVVVHAVDQWEQERARPRLRAFDAATCGTDDVPDLDAADLDRLAQGRSLLFVHGTFSRAHRGFGSLPDTALEELAQRYEGRMFAFDHPTVSVSPTDNADQFRDLCDGRVLDFDIIAHSRGGLVSRAITSDEKNPSHVGSIVFVATPNNGTALCDKGNHRTLLTVLTNLLGIIPGPVGDVLEIAASVAKHMAIGAFEALPGLTAMTPGDTYLTELGERNLGSTRLRAVASDYEPRPDDSIQRILRNRFTDVVFKGEGNDLVVPTASCAEVPEAKGFPIPDPCLFKRGDAIDHSSFWPQERFRAQILEWLKG